VLKEEILTNNSNNKFEVLARVPIPANTKPIHSCTKAQKPIHNNAYDYWGVSSHLNPLEGFRN
jgi:hypothetical protein